MSGNEANSPLREAARLTQMLDQVLGNDRFDLGPVPLETLMTDYSTQTAPADPIAEIRSAPINGCIGALVPAEDYSRWGVLYHQALSPGRKQYTLAHEFGHWLLHRGQMKDGIYCGEEEIFRRKGEGIEREADIFAANLLMPFHDFRRELPAKERPDFDRLGRMAARCGVSLTAAILRWLEYTETRALMVVSTDGFADWSKASQPAFKSGIFLRTRSTPVELPATSIAARDAYDDDSGVHGIEQPKGVWFDEPLLEMSIKADRWDRQITLLHFESSGPAYQGEENVEDVYDLMK